MVKLSLVCDLDVNVGLLVYCEISDMTSHPADISTTQGVSFHTVVKSRFKQFIYVCYHAVSNEMDRLVNNSVRGWSRVQLCNGEIG